MQTLAGLLGSNNQQLQSTTQMIPVVHVVRLVVGMDEALAGLPGCVANLVLKAPESIRGTQLSRPNVAAGFVTHFAIEMIKSPSALAVAQATIAREPTWLPKLVSDLSVVEAIEAGRERGVFRWRLGELLRSLCKNIDKKQLVAGMPGCLSTGGSLVCWKVRPTYKKWGRLAPLSDLVTDISPRGRRQKFMGLSQRWSRS